MQETDNYQIVNAINKERKLSAIREEILAMPAEKALDVILDAAFPATLVQSFPEQDLHFLMHHVGGEDFLPVLALASSQQWEYILDVEVWDNDRLDMVQMTSALALLYKADPERLIRWAVKEKIEFVEYYLFRNMEIRIREHDEDPSDFGDDFSTIDSVFYFRFPQIGENAEDITKEGGFSFSTSRNGEAKESYIPDNETSETLVYEDTETLLPETTETLITNMLNTLADMDMSVLHGLLLETGSVIPAETEEEEFRLRNVRLAEKGFLPPHEAVAVYQPLRIDDLRKRPAIFLRKPFIDSDMPTPPRYPLLLLDKQRELKKNSTMRGKSLFASALEHLNKNEDIALNLQSELAFLVNSVASADKKPVRSREDVEKTVEKTSCYLSLGMEVIYDNSDTSYKKALNSYLTVEIGASILQNYALKDIFRIGSGLGITLKERARQWYDKSYIIKIGLPLIFLDEKWLGIIGGLLLDRPLFFNNYEPNNRTSATFYRPFSSLEDVKLASSELESVIEIDKMVQRLKPDSSILSDRFLTWKSLFFTLWAMKRMGIESSSAGYCIPLNRFKPFFIQLLDLKSKRDVFIWDQSEKKYDQPETGCENPETCGKIGAVIRNDFLNWLVESGYVQKSDKEASIKTTGESGIIGNAVSANVRKIFEDIFDELEEEYGAISPEDIDPKLISHFIIK